MNYLDNSKGRLLDLAFASDTDDIKIDKADVPLSKVEAFHDPFVVLIYLHEVLAPRRNNSLERVKKSCFLALNRASSNDRLRLWIRKWWP